MSVEYSVVFGMIGMSLYFQVKSILVKKEYMETRPEYRNDFQYIEYRLFNVLSLLIILLLSFILPLIVTINDVGGNYATVISILDGFSRMFLIIFFIPIFTLIWEIFQTGLKSLDGIFSGKKKDEYDD